MVRIVRLQEVTICGKQTFNTLGSAQPLTLPTTEDPTQIQYVIISVSGGTVRFWETGDTPTSAQGVLINDGESVDIVGNLSITQLKMINASGSPLVNIQYYKRSFTTPQI